MNRGRKYERNCKIGKPTVGSGNKWFDKGDRNTENFKIELKSTSHNSYSLKKETVEKIQAEAKSSGKDWAMLIDLNGTELLIVSPFWFDYLTDA